MRFVILFILISLFLVFPARSETIQFTVDLDNTNPFTSQTMVGSFLTQCIKELSGAEIAILCSSGIKGSIYKGTTDSSVLPNLFYFPEDKVVLIELTGRQIKEIMERSIADYPDESVNFLQVSGLIGTFDTSLPAGQRIIDIYIGGNIIDLKRNYRVAVDDKLASGFSGYIIFTQGRILNSSSLTLRETVKQYIQSHPVIGRPERAGLKSR
ncbi:MAG TPA: 5'-nucleotidase [Candidatus Eremiobacteraeota bacterium]|nr:MAG: Trifunctional nucleotide phosphoesterase protein YfkN precursor [bacterium ADurb.Bin363]HPZ09720.1 5'-nucleotidase [Candidatus Eremiobacteraeota bacterium]